MAATGTKKNAVRLKLPGRSTCHIRGRVAKKGDKQANMPEGGKEKLDHRMAEGPER